MEEIFSGLIEFIMELYVELAAELVPEKKFKKWQTTLLKVICTIVSIGSVVLIVGGILLISEKVNTTAGIAMLSVGAAIVLAHIIAFFVIAVKEQNRLNKQNKDGEGDKYDR